MKLSANSWPASQRLQPIPGVSLGDIVPTAERLSREGSGSLAGRQMAVTDKFRFVERGLPAVNLRLVSPANALKTQNADIMVDRLKNSDPHTGTTVYGSRFLTQQGDTLSRIADVLTSLKDRATMMQNGETYNIYTGSTSNSGVVTISPRSTSSTGEYNVTVTALARNHQVGSDISSSPGAQLGYSGTIRINGAVITVEAHDTLFSIRDKINYGEDANHNGALDPAEDLNQNGAIDTFRAPGAYTGGSYLPNFYHNEDINGNGQLDPNEDANSTNLLEGNSAQTKVTATVSGDQLVIASTASVDIELMFKDPDKILENLGFLFRNDATAEVSVNSLNSQTVQAQKASLSIDGATQTGTTNQITDAVDGVILSLKGTGSATAAVSESTNNAVASVLGFTIGYNGVMNLLNGIYETGGTLASNQRLTSVYTDAVRSFFTPPPEAKGRLESFNDVGIAASDKQPTLTDELTFQHLPNLLTDRLGLPGAGGVSLPDMARRFGVNDVANYTATVDIATLDKRLQSESSDVGDLLGYAAERLQKRLDTHLQGDYGTIRFQKELVNYYQSSPGAAQSRIAMTTGAMETDVTLSAQRNIFSVIA